MRHLFVSVNAAGREEEPAVRHGEGSREGSGEGRLPVTSTGSAIDECDCTASQSAGDVNGRKPVSAVVTTYRGQTEVQGGALYKHEPIS